MTRDILAFNCGVSLLPNVSDFVPRIFLPNAVRHNQKH